MRKTILSATLSILALCACKKENIIYVVIPEQETEQAQEPEPEPEPSIEISSVRTFGFGNIRVCGTTSGTTTSMSIKVSMAPNETTLNDPSNWSDATPTADTFEAEGHNKAPNTHFLLQAMLTIGDSIVATSDLMSATTPAAPTTKLKGSMAKAIDMGLSVLWADHNIGAQEANDKGAYLCWGELWEKVNYTEDNYIAGAHVPQEIGSSVYYDVATVAWGNGWRMPTKEEMSELEISCTWTFETMPNKVMVATLTAPNGASIALPCAGAYIESKIEKTPWPEGLYWTSTEQYALDFSGDGKGSYIHSMPTKARWMGMSVRPVRDR